MLKRARHADARPRPEDQPAIRSLKQFNRCFATIYHQLRVIAPPVLPERGAGIVVCNHLSGLDPNYLQAPCDRLLTYMMAKEYYDVRALGWVFRTVGAIPVERSGRDSTATRAALRALAEGRILGVFPEGGIEQTHELMPFQPGVAMMAIKTGVPVYPAYLEGSQRGKPMLEAFLTRQRAMIAFGPAVEFDRRSTEKDALDAATQKIFDAVAQLKVRVEAET